MKEISIETIIREMFNVNEGDFALAAKLVDMNGQTILINEKEVFHAASTMKTPVMIEAFKQDALGIISLGDSLVIKNQSIVDSSSFELDINRDSGEKLYEQIGKKATFYDLVYDMIINSSNLATNIVIEKLAAQNVTQTMRDLGANDILVLRGVEDMKAFDKGLNNTTTAYDLMLIFEKLANGKAVNEKADSQMVNILLDQKHNSIIPAKLPENTKVAHKTGWISGVRHDSGIVFLPDGRKYVLVLLSKDVNDIEAVSDMMATVSKMIYDFAFKL